MLEQNHLRRHNVRIRPFIPCHDVIVSSGIYSHAKHENIKHAWSCVYDLHEMSLK